MSAVPVAEPFVFPEKIRIRPENAESILNLFAKKDGQLYDFISKNGFPTKRLERWKYTALDPVFKAIEGLSPLRVQLDDALSGFEDGGPAADYQEPSDTIWALAALGSERVYSVTVPKNTKLDKPLYLDVIAADAKALSCATIEIRLEQGAQAMLVETQSATTSEYWKNILMRIALDGNARLTHIRKSDENQTGCVTQRYEHILARDSSYKGYALIANAVDKHVIDHHVVLEGDNAHWSWNGATLAADSQLCDTTILIEHRAAHCTSSQAVRTVLDDQARGVFQGKVHVHQIAQKTDGYQLSNALLLSDTAEMDTKPELEIYADDVKCSHGATTGQLDEGHLFYLMARGIPKDQARHMLIEAFIAELFEDLEDTYADQFKEATLTWLTRR